MSDDATLREKQRRLRELQKQQGRYGIDTPPQIKTEIEDLEAEIARLEGSSARAGLPRPPQPDFAHPYPIQSGFTGRVDERKMLTGWLSSSPQPVLAMIGIGGMGKSALTWAWVQRDVLGLPLPGAAPEPPEAAACRLPEAARPAGVLWWSFYETQAGFASYLDEAIGYASDQRTNPRDIPSTYDKARMLLSLLQQRRLLLVLDGFERVLRAYSSMGAAYQGDAVEKQERGEHRACADPHAGRFLRDAATLPLKSRILITSRLFPRELDDLAGCGRKDLATIHPDNAVTFFHTQGIRGTRAEIQAACAPYGYHALALRLLAGVVKKNKRTPGDIKVASQYPVLPELKGREQHHILEVAYNQLDPPKRGLLSRLAAFRSPMAYDTLAALSNYTDSNRFDRALDELEERGLLFFDCEQARYDMHPVVRGYAYDRLGDKTSVHTRLRDYFAAVPMLDKDRVQSLDDLLPVIELYHHTVRSERYDEAIQLFRDHLAELLYFRFGAYQIHFELIHALFNHENIPPQLSDETNQTWLLNALAQSYSRLGQLRQAVKVFEQLIEFSENHGSKNLEIGQRNIIPRYIELGCLATADKSLSSYGEKKDQDVRLFFDSHVFLEATNRREREQIIDKWTLCQLLTYEGAFEEALNILNISRQFWEKVKERQGLCVNEFYRGLVSLWMGNTSVAQEAAQLSRELADVEHYERDIIRAEWLLGAALVAQAANNDHNTLLTEAEPHLTEALTRCRRINLVELEPDILLAWAKWHYLQGNPAQARADAGEALAIAERCEYRLKQADIHNFLARLALDAGDRAAARRHAEIARERAWCDGPPHCYKPALDEAERMLGETAHGESDAYHASTDA
jgi:tetratricopeptide (TPR) repeat protein